MTPGSENSEPITHEWLLTLVRLSSWMTLNLHKGTQLYLPGNILSTVQTWETITFSLYCHLPPVEACCHRVKKTNGKWDVCDNLKVPISCLLHISLHIHLLNLPQTNSRLHFKYIAGLLGNLLLCSLSPRLGD